MCLLNSWSSVQTPQLPALCTTIFFQKWITLSINYQPPRIPQSHKNIQLKSPRKTYTSHDHYFWSLSLQIWDNRVSVWELFVEMKFSRNSITNPRANTKLIYAAAANKQTRFPLNRMSIIITQFPQIPNQILRHNSQRKRQIFSQTTNPFYAVKISPLH